jgi:hypothetical protein
MIEAHGIKVLTVILYGCESSPTWKNERKLRLFGSWFPRKIFSSKLCKLFN